ncbi:MAG: alpha-amylase family glycosyl hydrolase [Thiotrichales bacterium]
MYEQISHALLNDVLDELRPEISSEDLRHFYTRLGANFYAIHTLFSQLYGRRDDFKAQLIQLTERLARAYIDRPTALKQLDMAREEDHTWFLSEQWVGMALYADGFAGDLKGVRERLSYLSELGINLVHVMPILKCPEGASDGGYAVSDFRDVDPRAGTLEDLSELSNAMRARGMLLTLDVVVNHTSDKHPWAQKARAGDPSYQDFYFCFPNRDVPDMFEETMPEIFPETAPGNFTWDEPMGRWVMTVFNSYQWDLNYTNPAVFIEMVDILLFWANRGADILRLDAVAFLWKKIGTSSQNEREAHLILQMLKDCCQVVAPGVLFIAEAIVAPSEIIKYFGEDAVIAKECEIAYNATFMALLWDAVATKNARLLDQGLKSLPNKLDRATWLNYVRCHDDIGLGFDDADIRACGYDPYAHRRFLVDWLTGRYDDSPARGRPFGVNLKNGDARIAGALASLIGLETALRREDRAGIDQAIELILTLHGMILAFGGLPLIWYGDELGTPNDDSFLDDPSKAADSRWVHRPRIDWTRAERRHQRGSVEQRVFDGLKRLIAVRKTVPAFADFNNRELIEVENPHLFAFLRTHPAMRGESVLAVANFDDAPQYLDLDNLGARGRDRFGMGQVQDLASGQTPAMFNGRLVVPPFRFYWLSDRRPGIGL